MTTDDRFTVLSALIDREPVSADALSAALEEREGRALLVDFVRLRALAGDALDGEAIVASGRRAVQATGGWMKWAAVVLLPVLMTIGGAVLYERWEEDQPPAPNRVIEFTPGVDWKASS